MIRAAFFDVDGTLFSHKTKQIPPSTHAALKALKSEQEWSDLADYYLALRYVLCLVDTGLSNEMNTAVGMQMMLSFMTMGNRHAFAFCQTCLSEN